MPTTLMDAPEYDSAKARRKQIRIAQILAVVLLVSAVVWWFRYLPQERVVDHFLTAIEQSHYEQAYGIWLADPDWQQHPEKYSRYKFSEFYRDWGPGGELGLIREHKIDGAERPKQGHTGIVVIATVNQRKVQAHIYVDDKDHSLSFWQDFIY